MATPRRPKKTTRRTVQTTTTEEPVQEDVVTEEETSVDKDALIQELQKQVKSQDEHESIIKDLQRRLAEAEKKAGSTAASNSNKAFKLRPDPDDDEKYYYWEITWHPKRSESEEDFVTLGVNGKLMMWPRNVPTVIRSDYLEVADNAFTPKFKQLPGEERKEIGGLKPFTYHVNRKIDEEEYRKRKKAGDKALREYLESKGISA